MIIPYKVGRIVRIAKAKRICNRTLYHWAKEASDMSFLPGSNQWPFETCYYNRRIYDTIFIQPVNRTFPPYKSFHNTKHNVLSSRTNHHPPSSQQRTSEPAYNNNKDLGVITQLIFVQQWSLALLARTSISHLSDVVIRNFSPAWSHFWDTLCTLLALKNTLVVVNVLLQIE